jgi:tetratricopeptide (TPR) repeat protein
MALSDSAHPKLRDDAKAIEYATKACAFSAWEEVWVIENLARVYAAAGKFDLAVKWQNTALELCRKNRESDYECRRVLKLYERKQPYSEPTRPQMPSTRSQAGDQRPAPCFGP